jgi:hypothetical protein
LKPILSRFCEIYIPEPVINGQTINLYKYNLNETFKLKDVKTLRNEWLKKELLKSVVSNTNMKLDELIVECTKLYEKGYSGLDIIALIENQNNYPEISLEKRYELLFAFNKVRKEFRNEKILILFILNFTFLNNTYNLENISFM